MADIFDLFRSIEQPSPNAPVTCLIVGLGNPGQNYEGTRHNTGFSALDTVAKALGARVDRLRFKALTARAEIDGQGVLLMKPQTYMNLSGEAVGEAAHFYKIPPERVFVLCDDISFEPGRMRLREKGSAGGHNGLKSIIASLGSEDFPRFKIGVGSKPSPETDLADWVLGRLSPDGKAAQQECFDRVLPAIRLMLKGKTEEAKSRYSN